LVNAQIIKLLRRTAAGLGIIVIMAALRPVRQKLPCLILTNTDLLNSE
jgi:hypothetical protein